MNRILSVKELKLGYCNQCNMPRIVAVCVLSGWKHEFSICENCLAEIIKMIHAGSKAIAIPQNPSSPPPDIEGMLL